MEKFTGKLPIKPRVTIKLPAASARNEPFTTFTTAVKTAGSCPPAAYYAIVLEGVSMLYNCTGRYSNTRYNSRRYKPAYYTTVLESTRQHLNTTRRYKTALYKKDAGHLQHSQLMLKLDQTKIVSKYDKFIRHYKYCARQGIIDRRKGVNLY